MARRRDNPDKAKGVGILMVGVTSVRRRVRAFALGRQFVTTAARAELSGECIQSCFRRHANGDFGDVCEQDFDANIDAIASNARVLSVYRCQCKDGEPVKVYVITEADRSATLLLLAEDY